MHCTKLMTHLHKICPSDRVELNELNDDHLEISLLSSRWHSPTVRVFLYPLTPCYVQLSLHF